MLYGATHSLDMGAVAKAVASLHQQESLILILGLVFIMAGLAFKLGAVPFHMWIPDVYEGAPVAATLFITAAPKIAAFAVVYRILFEMLPGLHVQWQQIIILLSVLSMLLGNIAAIVQNNIKRMFAYSTIAHGGYMLLGICAATPAGFSASMYYAIVYAVMSVGGFGLLTLLSRRGVEIDHIDDLRGLNARNPALALIMLIVLFSMAGIPPTVGFFAKLGVLKALVYAPVNLIWLASLAIVLAVIGSYYYLRVVKVMYFDEPEEVIPVVMTPASKWSINIAGIAVLLLGILPSGLIDATWLAVHG
jgi:NADH-quinone oxidoreductase subunit N